MYVKWLVDRIWRWNEQEQIHSMQTASECASDVPNATLGCMEKWFNVLRSLHVPNQTQEETKSITGKGEIFNVAYTFHDAKNTFRFLVF